MKSTNSKEYTVGIDAGSVSLNCIVINQNKDVVFESAYKRHFGKIDEEILSLVEGLFHKFGEKRIRSTRIRLYFKFITTEADGNLKALTPTDPALQAPDPLLISRRNAWQHLYTKRTRRRLKIILTRF
jgi:hypothetical protein